MWEISENLHRAELPQMERDKLIAEWCRLVGKEDKPAQVGQVSPGDVVGVHPIHILLNKLK